MDFEPSPRAADLARRVRTFVETEVEPLEPQLLREESLTRLDLGLHEGTDPSGEVGGTGGRLEVHVLDPSPLLSNAQ